ncbi:MAG: hypothetical protein M3R24_11610 [Chloroflexota bacterium]|nr:hypothetical protein [Chloroflexota bacterium]
MSEAEQEPLDDAERMRRQERELQPEHDTTGLAAELQQVQNDIEARQLEGKIRLGRAMGNLDPTPDAAANNEP